MSYPVSTPSSDVSARLRAGEIFHGLQVEALAPNGRGIVRVNGRAIWVPETAPGDVIAMRLTRIRRDRLEGKLLSLEARSTARVEPPCPHFGPCGGCDLQHLAYPAQLNWKKELLVRTLQEQAGLKDLPAIQVGFMDDPWGYRTKMEFSFGQQGQRITVGLHERGSFQRIVDLTSCRIAPEPVSALIRAIKETANRLSLKAYDPKIHEGFWRYAVVRCARDSGHLMLLIVTNDGPAEPIDRLVQELPQQVPVLKSMYWGVSRKVSDVAQPDETRHVFGSEVLEDRIGDIRFQIRPMNFVQPNLILASRIYETVRTAADLTGREVVYDLYSGIGLIALYMARQAAAVYGVESEAENVALAEKNADLNGILNTTFLHGRVEDLLKGRALFKMGPQPDCIIVDPPRAGLHKEVYAPLLEAKSPRLVYLSCNPASLARDLKIILTREPAYRLNSVCLFDFFPHTTHMEVLVTLHR
ncbi:MAG: 23S rRNA (uracil(1939)-C(5))-methyltransferase RlmD [Candidatus Omnitrophica bacterium]|nr:23S rRNA (uracil(1939)-C(5))-methyltransferase RlmD [Candidatus Omnitrophota bacterium]